MAHFGPVQITGINPVVSSGAADSRLELWFDTVPEAAAARHAAAEDQLVRLRALPGGGDVTVPVQLTAGRCYCQHSCIIMHRLPYEYCTEGLTQTLLECAGCPSDTYVVRGEFVGDLPGHSPPAALWLAVVRPAWPISRRRTMMHLARLPKRSFIDDRHHSAGVDAAAKPASFFPGSAAATAARSPTAAPPLPDSPTPAPALHTGPRARGTSGAART